MQVSAGISPRYPLPPDNPEASTHKITFTHSDVKHYARFFSAAWDKVPGRSAFLPFPQYGRRPAKFVDALYLPLRFRVYERRLPAGYG